MHPKSTHDGNRPRDMKPYGMGNHPPVSRPEPKAEGSRKRHASSETSSPSKKQRTTSGSESKGKGKSNEPRKVEVAIDKLSKGLRRAIRMVDDKRLRGMVLSLCAQSDFAETVCEKHWLVEGKDVLRYHESDEETEEGDEDSEDRDREQDDDEDKGANTNRKDGKQRKKVKFQTPEKIKKEEPPKPIYIGDSEKVYKYGKCLNCNTEFDLSSNDRKDCAWHPDKRRVDLNNGYWDDKQDDPLTYFALNDDPAYSKGFVYPCCGKGGDTSGCKATRHKVAENIPRNPVWKICKNRGCGVNYDFNDPGDQECIYHTGKRRKVDQSTNSSLENVRKNPVYEDGFVWSCCGGTTGEGCQRGSHKKS